MNILLGHLNSNGDCVLATTIARQIKEDYPSSRLTWAIGSKFKSVIINNPHVDEVIEFPLNQVTEENVIQAWKLFIHFAEEQRRLGSYDHIFCTQYSYGSLDNFMGITRASIFAGYPNKIRGPVRPVIRLTETELENVRKFADDNFLKKYYKVILFECSSYSGQSFVDNAFVLAFCQMFLSKPEYCIILSSNQRYESTSPNIISAHTLSFRENVKLFDHCDLLVGCSSGVTWLSISESVKDLPKIILLNSAFSQASMKLDHQYFKMPHDNIIELAKCSPSDVVDIIEDGDFNNRAFDKLRLTLKYEEIVFVKPFYYHFQRGQWKNIFLLLKKSEGIITLRLLVRLVFMSAKNPLFVLKAIK